MYDYSESLVCGPNIGFFHASVKLLSNDSSSGWGREICSLSLSLAGCRRPCHSQSQGMPHTFCLFYMSKQIVNWLIIFVLTMSFTAVSLLSSLFALFKYEPSGPPLRCTPSALKSHQFSSISSYLKFIGGNHLLECSGVSMETKGSRADYRRIRVL